MEVGFLKETPSAAARRALDALGNDRDSVTATGREIFWVACGGISGSTISGQAIEKAVGQRTTFRSLKMLRRLHANLNPSD